jgi:hypothetical protein
MLNSPRAVAVVLASAVVSYAIPKLECSLGYANTPFQVVAQDALLPAMSVTAGTSRGKIASLTTLYFRADY